jgi:hypothetical protein
MVLPVKPRERLGNKLLDALPGEEYGHILPYQRALGPDQLRE